MRSRISSSEVAPSVYIGGGFLDPQLFWIIPVVHGYCRGRGIKRLIFERRIDDVVKNSQYLRSILKNYDLITEDKRGRGHSCLRKALTLSFSLRPTRAFRLARSVCRESLLRGTKDFSSEILHSVWDQALLGVPDGTLDISFPRRFIASLAVLSKISQASRLFHREKVAAAFLGHSVYVWRAMVTEFRKNRIEVFVQAENALYRLLVGQEGSWNILTREEWQAAIGLSESKDIRTFWEQRKRGKSHYEEGRMAAVSTKRPDDRTPKNIIFLHIFRDSPYEYIDPDRLYSDFVDWVMRTLEIIARSNEDWLIKFHPGAARWGENQAKWVAAIVFEVFGPSGLPSHIKISAEEYSNFDLFGHASRVVTYSGTAHLEAACSGVRPIVISHTTLASFDSGLVLKPKNKADYEEMLLVPSASEEFALSTREQTLARQVLFVRDNILGLGKDNGFQFVYRQDTAEAVRALGEFASAQVAGNEPRFAELGTALEKGLSRTVRLDYFHRWKKAIAPNLSN